MRDRGGEGEVSAWWNPQNDLANSWEMVRSSWLNVLLLACPFGIASHMLGWPATTVFLLVRRHHQRRTQASARPLSCSSSAWHGVGQQHLGCRKWRQGK